MVVGVGSILTGTASESSCQVIRHLVEVDPSLVHLSHMCRKPSDFSFYSFYIADKFNRSPSDIALVKAKLFFCLGIAINVRPSSFPNS